MSGPATLTECRGTPTWVKFGFLGFLLAYVVASAALRGQFEVRYNDTEIVRDYVVRTTDDSDEQMAARGTLGRLEYWQELWLPADHAADGTGHARPYAFRPLQLLYKDCFSVIYMRHGVWLPIISCFLLLGLSGYLIFRLFQEVGSEQMAAVCTAAYLFFPAVVSPAWNPIAGPQSLIPGGFAAALLAYLHYLSTGRRRHLLPIGLVCVAGPWFKETLGIVAFLLLAHQLFVAPTKRWGLMAALVLACVHAVFPEAALRLLFTGTVSWLSIFECGSLHDHAVAQSWRPNFPMDLVAMVPPSLLLVSMACIVVCTYHKQPTIRLALPAWLMRCAIPLARGILFVMSALSLLCLTTLIVGRPTLSLATTAPTALLTIALYGALYVDILVAGWFCSMFLPLLRIYFSTTQCGYVAAPLAYLLAAPLVHACGLLSVDNARLPSRWALKCAIAIIGVVAFGDNALSLPNACIAYQKTEQFNDQILPPDVQHALTLPTAEATWKFIENSLAVDDAVILASRFHLGRGNYNFDYGVPPAHVLRSGQELERLLSNYNCVVAIADYVDSVQHEFWDIRSLERYFRKVDEQTVSFDGYYADPLRRLIDNRYRSMMGPPDFQHEFVKTKQLFREQFTNRYHIYVRERGADGLAGLREVIEPALKPVEKPVVLVPPEAIPVLVLASYQGFNVIACDHAFFALPETGGAFDLAKARAHGYQTCYEAPSLEPVKRLIEQDAARARAAKAHQAKLKADPTPHLALAGFQGFNIIACDGRFYGLPEMGEAFDLARVRAHAYAKCHEGSSVDEVKRLIIESSPKTEIARKPTAPPAMITK